MKLTILILAIASLTGCSICRNHETACATVTLVAVGSIALMAGPHGNHQSGADHTATIPGLDCSKVSCK